MSDPGQLLHYEGTATSRSFPVVVTVGAAGVILTTRWLGLLRLEMSPAQEPELWLVPAALALGVGVAFGWEAARRRAQGLTGARLLPRGYAVAFVGVLIAVAGGSAEAMSAPSITHTQPTAAQFVLGIGAALIAAGPFVSQIRNGSLRLNWLSVASIALLLGWVGLLSGLTQPATLAAAESSSAPVRSVVQEAAEDAPPGGILDRLAGLPAFGGEAGSPLAGGGSSAEEPVVGFPTEGAVLSGGLLGGLFDDLDLSAFYDIPVIGDLIERADQSIDIVTVLAIVIYAALVTGVIVVLRRRFLLPRFAVAAIVFTAVLFVTMPRDPLVALAVVVPAALFIQALPAPPTGGGHGPGHQWIFPVVAPTTIAAVLLCVLALVDQVTYTTPLLIGTAVQALLLGVLLYWLTLDRRPVPT